MRAVFNLDFPLWDVHKLFSAVILPAHFKEIMWSPAFASDVNCSACAVWVYGEHPRGYRQHCRTAAHSLWTVTYTGEISRTVSTWLRAGRTQVNSTKQPPHSTTYSKHTKHTRWRSGSGLAGRFLHLPGLLQFRPVPLSPCFPDASIR